jgi:hypothetical protein
MLMQSVNADMIRVCVRRIGKGPPPFVPALICDAFPIDGREHNRLRRAEQDDTAGR